jgi:superfamily II DNA helicase RecQ
MFNAIAAEAMETVWGRQPIGYQQVVIPHILEMMADATKPEAILLVQATGSGKSAVPQTLSVVNGGLTIIIENTLSLGSDQTSKIQSANEYSGGRVISFQLDEVKNVEQQSSLSKRIIDLLESKPAISIILFSSPEAIMTKVWIDMFTALVEKKLLRLFCIDEVHLFH